MNWTVTDRNELGDRGWRGLLGRALIVAAAAVVLALPTGSVALAAGPDVVTAEAGASGSALMPGVALGAPLEGSQGSGDLSAVPSLSGPEISGVVTGAVPATEAGAAGSASTDAEIAQTTPSPGATNVRPVAVWTTDRYGYPRTTFWRGETIAFWVRLHNPSWSYATYDLQLWVDDLIRCVTTPCDGGPQRLFAGRVWVRPGYTTYYLLARSEYTDKVGEWRYYATDPAQTALVSTSFWLR